MLHHGYINFFENICCFVSLDEDNFFRELKDGDSLLLGDELAPCTLHCENGKWTLEGAALNSELQGARVVIREN